MTNLRILIVTTILILSSNLSKVYSQDNANEGTRFLVTFPQNENTFLSHHRQNVRLGIYISSKYATNVTIKNHFNNVTLNNVISANGFIRFDNFELGNRSDIEDLSDGTISKKVIEITSEFPISVAVINSKEKTSDGYLAYPISEWGKNYIHNSLYHHKPANEFERSSGFTIIAQENNSNIKVILKGKNSDNGTTKSGNHRIGDTLNILLNANQSYTVKTKSNYNNTFDLSGSFIASDKKIGLISFHERTLIPQVGTENGKDHLIEMQQPLSNWRNKYVSVDFGREYGDFFRVLPLKDNTNLIITNYNEAGTLVSKNNVILNTGGGFYEFNNIELPERNKNFEVGIKGNTVWEADSPVLVTQYSYSYSWDNTPTNSSNSNFDPFMINLINEEQFTNSISFIAPPYNDFEYHNINLILKVDTSQNIRNQLESVLIDNKQLISEYPILNSNRIGNTVYYWLRVKILSGVHNIESNIPFAAFLYGFGNADSYGMQTALGNLKLDDTLVKETIDFNCEIFNVRYNIKSTFGENNNNFQSLDLKIKDYKVLESQNLISTITLSDDSLSLLLNGKTIDPIVTSFIYIELTSETGRVFYDSLYYEYENTISINEGVVKRSIPGDRITFEVFIDEANDSLYFLNNFNFSIKYQREWFKLEDVVLENKSIKENITYKKYLDTVYANIDLPIIRNEIINGNRILIDFQTLLNKDTVMKPEFILFSKFENTCYRGKKEDTVNSEICIQNLRLIQVIESKLIEINSNKLFALQDVNISIFDYKGSLIQDNLFLNKSEILELSSKIKASGIYFITINNYQNIPPLKYFHF